MLGRGPHKTTTTNKQKKTEKNNPERARGWAGWREECGREGRGKGLGEEEVKKDK